ncbi:MAG: NRDE family protein [Acidimicrobiia bacterium]
MCLLVVLSRVVPGVPLVVGGNRDERLDRPAEAMAVLRDAGPQVLGGRDLKAGGTWLAVNEHGVVAGLTNRPLLGGPDATRRSRGDLPLALTAHPSAQSAVAAFVREHRAGDYNPAWLLVGDREVLLSVEMAGEGDIVVTELPPGVHVLENRALGIESGKVDLVRSKLAGIESRPVDEVVARLEGVLGDHEIPDEPPPEEPPPPPPPEPGEEPAPPRVRLPEVRAACVHTEEFGTRWSGLVTVPADPSARPGFRFADGHPCTTPFEDASARWD